MAAWARWGVQNAFARWPDPDFRGFFMARPSFSGVNRCAVETAPATGQSSTHQGFRSLASCLRIFRSPIFLDEIGGIGVFGISFRQGLIRLQKA
jgi:hypothetical protein